MADARGALAAFAASPHVTKAMFDWAQRLGADVTQFLDDCLRHYGHVHAALDDAAAAADAATADDDADGGGGDDDYGLPADVHEL
jgi:hypothetical protein